MFLDAKREPPENSHLSDSTLSRSKDRKPFPSALEFECMQHCVHLHPEDAYLIISTNAYSYTLFDLLEKKQLPHSHEQTQPREVPDLGSLGVHCMSLHVGELELKRQHDAIGHLSRIHLYKTSRSLSRACNWYFCTRGRHEGDIMSTGSPNPSR